MKKLMGLRLSPKVGYLAKLAARERLMSLNAFVEQALWNEIQKEEEPDYGMVYRKPAASPVSRFEGFWDDDEATRLFLLATGKPELLSPAEMRMYRLLSDGIVTNGERLSLKSFCDAYGDPMVDKTHLQRGEA